jgi:regulator of nucleoside diphosphate kinase
METRAKEPSIYITQTDLSRLQKLIEIWRNSGSASSREYIDKLEYELDRAEIVEPNNVPKGVITMRSTVRLRDLDTGKESIYSLVFPDEADSNKGKISILAPIGTAMIGYRTGDIIEWNVPAGLRTFKVEDVIYQPEAAGDYHL